MLEGRRVVNNIERSASLFLVKNIFSFLMSIFSMVFMITYPIEPSQISLINMFTIGTPAFFLALEPNHNIIKGRFLPNVLVKALPAGLTDFFVIAAFVIFCSTFDIPQQYVSTACTPVSYTHLSSKGGFPPETQKEDGYSVSKSCVIGRVGFPRSLLPVTMGAVSLERERLYASPHTALDSH